MNRYQALVETRETAKRAALAARDSAVSELRLQIAEEQELCTVAVTDAEEAFHSGIEFFRRNLADAANATLAAEIEAYAYALYRDNGRKLMNLIRQTQESCVGEANSYFDPRWLVAAVATRVSHRNGPITSAALEAAHRVVKACFADDIAALEIEFRALESACNGLAQGTPDDEARMALILSVCDYDGLAARLSTFEAQVKARREVDSIVELERLHQARTKNTPEPPALSILELVQKLAPELASALNL